MNKKILALIEPYMDKTLSFGCLLERIIFKDYEGEDGIYQIFTNKTRYSEKGENCIYRFHMHEIYIKCNTDTWMMTKKEFLEHYKILGHYDITAVLSYIKSFKGIMCYVFDEIFGEGNVFQVYKLADMDNFGYYYIQNKPLHLYTEQEEKDLLKLLLKLK